MDIQHPDLHPLFAEHIATLKQRSDSALARGGFDHLVAPAGIARLRFLDDSHYPFHVNPQFKHWLPVTKAPGSWIVYTPGRKPKLIYLQPADYWHVVPDAPAGYWTEHFDIVIIREADEALAELPKDVARCAILGEDNSALAGFTPNNPQAVLDYLHYHRAIKTEYELAMMRVANKIGARAHRAAETAFRAGESEFGIHMAYLKAAHQTDNELPYTNIIALNEHAAVLHYMQAQTVAPSHSHSFLIDAGASFHGYASDITRTYAADPDSEFQSLIGAVDAVQKNLCALVFAGKDYASLHIEAHHQLASVLKDFGFIRMSAESAVESGVSSIFFPHGLGHPIGLQVHDVAGFAADESGKTIDRPQGHPYLRMTRKIEANAVVTIEPGLYFIDMLLKTLKDKPEARDIHWERIDAFRKYGGIRIEDDVACSTGEPENLTRNAFAALTSV
ncbi:MAG: Xaa-Pro dipeptidase [Dokdonella sp.]